MSETSVSGVPLDAASLHAIVDAVRRDIVWVGEQRVALQTLLAGVDAVILVLLPDRILPDVDEGEVPPPVVRALPGLVIELETKVIQRYAKISQSLRRPPD